MSVVTASGRAYVSEFGHMRDGRSELNYALYRDQPPVVTSSEERHGYAAIVVTATEDWGVRDVVGGIGPQLDSEKGLGYTIQHGVLTWSRTCRRAAASTGAER